MYLIAFGWNGQWPTAIAYVVNDSLILLVVKKSSKMVFFFLATHFYFGKFKTIQNEFPETITGKECEENKMNEWKENEWKRIKHNCETNLLSRIWLKWCIQVEEFFFPVIRTHIHFQSVGQTYERTMGRKKSFHRTNSKHRLKTNWIGIPSTTTVQSFERMKQKNEIQ